MAALSFSSISLEKKWYLRVARLLSDDSCKEAVKVAGKLLRLYKDGRLLLKIRVAFRVAFYLKIQQNLKR
jgi:hypothetical protein